ncbi:hypothetical protein D9611_005626 [Ephemerocybe angulata]|uniref:DH domain-containing protein n=1 Tax=Ephemerocybe angulata TaxID=980116 RepID=A0A8H5BHG0_9AGAR|nr:hypothetical protein D9611_005626 [Tulosesus angulatus]
MGLAKTSEGKRSLSSPSLFRRLSTSSANSTAVRLRWASFISSKRVSNGSRTSTIPDADEDDDSEEDHGFLPIIRAGSPLDPFNLMPPTEELQQDMQRDQPVGRHKHKRSTSWSEILAIFPGRSDLDVGSDDVLIKSDQPHGKRKPKFTLESPSDIDLPHQPETLPMSSSTLSAPTSTAITPVTSSSSLASAQAGPSSPIPRPHLIRRDASSNPSRRYTFAMAMTDEQISDEVLVEELERIRAVKAWTGSNGGDLEEFWDLGHSGSSQSQSPNFDSNSSSEQQPKGFFEAAVCDSPGEQVDPESDAYMGIAVTTDTIDLLPFENRAAHRGSLPVFPVHRLSNSPGLAPSPTATSPPNNFNSARTSLVDTSDASWHTARRALLTCRECVRTERHYLSGMRALVSQDTQSPPPPLMLSYAENLMELSERLLARMEENPNVWGVTAAFIGEESALEEGFVGWCGKVGAWFEGRAAHVAKDKGKAFVQPQQPMNPKAKPAPVRKLSRPKSEDAPSSPLKRSMSTWKKTPSPSSDVPSSGSSALSSASSSTTSSESATSAVSTSATSIASSVPASKASTPAPSSPTVAFVASSLLKGKRDKGSGKLAPSSSSASVVRQKSDGSTTSSAGSSSVVGNVVTKPPRKPPAVRELAILPTQRVMRYVLLFKDLLAHTPSTSPARALVERAVDAAVRIADKCDQAQNHDAFAHVPPVPKSSDAWNIHLTWSRRSSSTKLHEKESLPHSKSVSEHGHGSTSLADPLMAALGSMSLPPSRPASIKSISSIMDRAGAPKVLVKPRRSSSTGAVASAIATAGASTQRSKDHTGDCPNRLVKGKKKTQSHANAPPPSSFSLRAQASCLAEPQ